MSPTTDALPSDPRLRWRRIIFEHDTRAGRLYDVALIVAIVASVLVVMADSLQDLGPRVRQLLLVLEWLFTVLFTVDYAARLWSAPSALGYARSFYGVIDLVSTVPTWLSLVFPAGRFLTVVRILRVLRIFRVLKLATYVREAGVLGQAVIASRHKITVFVFTVVTIIAVVGSLMYMVEGPANGFTSIPTAMYWAVVTLTTVGYGDISPGTTLGRFLASALMILGYGVIAVPTGIVTMELQKAARSSGAASGPTCPGCGRDRHEDDARHCARCGTRLPDRA